MNDLQAKPQPTDHEDQRPTIAPSTQIPEMGLEIHEIRGEVHISDGSKMIIINVADFYAACQRFCNVLVHNQPMMLIGKDNRTVIVFRPNLLIDPPDIAGYITELRPDSNVTRIVDFINGR